MIYDEATALRALLAGTPDLIAFLDRDGRYRFVARALAEVAGQTVEAMLGRTPREVGFDAAVVDAFEGHRRMVMETGQTVRTEAILDLPLGRVVLDYVVTPVVADGEVLGTFVVTRDITESRRAADALRESETKFSIAFDRSPLALTITSLDDGKLVNVNEGFVRMSGYTREESVGKSPDELGLWIDPAARAERFAKLRNGEPVPDVEARFKVKNGVELIGVVGSAVVDINARPCVLSSVVDITERKRAEETLRASEARFHEFADTAPAMLWITEADGRCSFRSRGWYEFTGRSEAESLGFGWMNVVHPDDRTSAHDAFLAANARREEFGLDYRIRRFDGEYRWVIDSARPRFGPHGELLGYIGSVIDITDRKRAEQAKDEFLATLSHELRTPLTSGYGWVKLLQKSRDPELVETGLRAIEQSLSSQIRLIDDLLDVSRIATGKVHIDMHALDLRGVVDSALATVQHAADAKEIAVRINADAPLTVIGDASRLQQVIWNLLSNAIKFTPPGGLVEVDLVRHDIDAHVIVRDTGEGIDPAFLPHVFDRFRQGDSSISRRHGGLGIGLAIVASLVDAHRGTVRAESEGVGKGATFTVTLPII